MSRAEEANSRAAAFILAQEDGNWTPMDQAKLDAWLAEAEGHKAAYWRMRHSWRETARIKALGQSPEVQRRAWRVWVPASIAASILAILGASYLMANRVTTPVSAPTTIATRLGATKLVGLADGSKVQLNTASLVRTAVTNQRREVWLEQGEAFFEVRHIDGRPFVVHAGRSRITVLGTKFSVRRDGDKVTVAVLEGRVRVDEVAANRETRASIISRGDIVQARGDTTLVTGHSETRVEETLAWRTGLLNFEQASLAQIAAEFNRYNAKPIIVTDPKAASLQIGGVFPATNPQAFVRLLHDAYGLTVVETAEAVKISN